jgi:hypothetical protein
LLLATISQGSRKKHSSLRQGDATPFGVSSVPFGNVKLYPKKVY